MANRDRLPAAGRRRTGVSRRTVLPSPRRSLTSRDWLALAAIGALAMIVLGVLVSLLSPGPTVAVPSPTPASSPPPALSSPSTPSASAPPTATQTASPSPTPSPTPSLTPAVTAPPTPSPSLSPNLSPTPSPTPSPSPTPTLSPTPSPSPTATLAPTPAPVGTIGPAIPPTGLVFLEPAERSVTSSGVVVIRGLAAPGSIITRDIPLWFDEHTTTDAVGRWSMAVALKPGENVLTFRVSDDLATTRTLTLHYLP